MKQDIDLISYMSAVEDTRTKSMFITHFGRNKIVSLFILDIIMKILLIITAIIALICSFYVAPKTH